jgi:hypothetical protein
MSTNLRQLVEKCESKHAELFVIEKKTCYCARGLLLYSGNTPFRMQEAARLFREAKWRISQRDRAGVSESLSSNSLSDKQSGDVGLWISSRVNSARKENNY